MFAGLSEIAIGLGVGILVGITGMGGGALLLPLLIFGLHVPPITAIGSDSAVNFISKIGGSVVHARQGTVNWRLVRYLAAGSIPGSLVGVAVIVFLRGRYGTGVNDVLRVVLGVVLVVISALLLVQRSSLGETPSPESARSNPTLATCLVGFVGGFLVGLTSIGAGTVIMLLLLLLYRFPVGTLVGSDIAHAVVLTGVTSAMHFRLGMVDPTLVAFLLLGAIPGVLLGSRLLPHVPAVALRRVLCAILFAIGARMVFI